MIQIDMLSALLSTRFGLKSDPAWEAKIEASLRRISDRRGVTFSGLALRSYTDMKLLREVAGLLTVEESYFFRQAGQLPLLVDFLATQLSNGGPGPVRVWSAGCAAGQEPYSVAIALAERLLPRQLEQVDILASDLNHEAIARARVACYGRWALRDMPQDLKLRYFVADERLTFKLHDTIRRMARFEHLSIQERLDRQGIHSLDAILFRNVAVYLSPAALNRIYQAFARVLHDDGLLLISATDPRPDETLFLTDPHGDHTIFHKAVGSTWPMLPDQQRTSSRPRAPVSAIASSSPVMGDHLLEREWQQAQADADRGEYQKAKARCDKLITAHPTAKDGFFLRGLIAASTGEYAAAIEDFHRVLFIEPTDSIARYWYALALYRAARTKEARQQAQTLIQMLATDTGLEPNAAAELLRAAKALYDLME